MFDLIGNTYRAVTAVVFCNTAGIMVYDTIIFRRSPRCSTLAPKALSPVQESWSLLSPSWSLVRQTACSVDYHIAQALLRHDQRTVKSELKVQIHFEIY